MGKYKKSLLSIFLLLCSIIKGSAQAPLLKEIQKVLSIDTLKRIDTSSFLYNDISKKWKLNKKQVSLILKNSTEISSFEKLEVFDDIPCYVSGKLKTKDGIYQYTIFGGAVITVNDSLGNLYYYGCKNRKCQKFFISPWISPEKL